MRTAPSRAALAAIALAIAAAAHAGTYRCTAPDGSVRFTDAPASCEDPVPHEPSRRIERAPAPPAAAPPRGADLAAVLLGEVEAGDGWETVGEAPSDPSGDADLREWGVSAQLARHYTRDLAGTVEVCSVELWRFASLEQAAAAEAHFRYPDWRIRREGALLVMLRGLRRPPGEPPRRGVFADCASLGDRIEGRARAKP